MWILLFPILAFAAPIKWEITTELKPRAVFFDAGRDALLVSADDGEGRAQIDQYSLDGKLEKKALVKASGEAGALRTYGEKIFWLVGGVMHDEKGKALAGRGIDVTVQRGGKPITADGVKDFGIYQKNDKIYLLQANGAVGDTKLRACPADCRWLEADSAGNWLSVSGRNLFRSGKAPKVAVEFPSTPGRPAYVFRKDTSQDFLVTPFPAEQKLRAYEMGRP